MGAQLSKKDEIINTTLNENIINILQSDQTNITTINSNKQTMNVKVDEFICEDITIKQTINSEMNVINNISTSQVDEIKNEFEKAIENKLKAVDETEIELGSPLLDKENETKIVNEINEIIKTNVTQESMKTIITKSFNVQGQDINIGKIKGKACNFGQDMHVSLIASTIIDDIQSLINENKSVQELKSDLEDTTKLKATGFAGLVKAIMSPLGMSVMGAGLVFIICIIGLLFMIRTPAGQEAIKEAPGLAEKAMQARSTRFKFISQ